MAQVTNDLIYEVLRSVQADISDLKKMRVEMREGFASVKSFQAASLNEQALLERRVVSVESDIERIKTRLNLIDDPR